MFKKFVLILVFLFILTGCNIYVINYEFKETYEDQNADQGKVFRTNLEIVVK